MTPLRQGYAGRDADLRILITPVAGRYGLKPAVLDVFRNLASGVVTIAPRYPAAAVILDTAGHHELLQALACPGAQRRQPVAKSTLKLRNAKPTPADPGQPIVAAGRHEKGFRR